MPDERTYKIIGCAMEVHKELGCGFLEGVYQEAIFRELTAQAIPYKREARLQIKYKLERLNKFYIADFICFDSVVVEIKALQYRSGVEEAQLINYLKATGYHTGLLLNFGRKSLEYKRVVNSQSA